MSIDLYFQYFSDPGLSKDCNVFRAAALDAWNRIRFSRTTPRLKIHETSITQNLVYEMNLLRHVVGARYQIFESVDERSHGDDLEICVQMASGSYIKLAVQAKILYHNLKRRKQIRLDDGAYQQLEHFVGRGSARQNQVDLLLRYARRNGSAPLYLLYNYVANPGLSTNFCGVPCPPEQYGCSIVSAQYLKDHHAQTNGNLKKNVRFSHLHPKYAVPWFVLTCCLAGSSIDHILQTLRVTKPDYDLTEHSPEQLLQESGWSELVADENKDSVAENRVEFNSEPEFLPKFRLIIREDAQGRARKREMMLTRGR